MLKYVKIMSYVKKKKKSVPKYKVVIFQYMRYCQVFKYKLLDMLKLLKKKKDIKFQLL